MPPLFCASVADAGKLLAIHGGSQHKDEVRVYSFLSMGWRRGTKGVESDVLRASSAYLTFAIGAQCNMYTCMGKVPGGYGATGGTTNMA